MNTYWKLTILACAALCLASGLANGQQTPDSGDTSLGDVARKLNAQKPKETKPPKVFTNDNLTTQAGSESSVTSSEKKPADESSAQGKEKAEGAHDEAYYRSQMSKLQGQLDTHKRELDVLQQKLGQNNMQYYPDPNKSLLQQYNRSDINKLTADIDAKKQQIADDEKAIEDLRDQLRRDGGDPAWLR